MADVDDRLLKSKKNEILIIIKQAALGQMEFEWEELEKHEDDFSDESVSFTSIA